MADNVIIFGAGASFDAGIPLLGNFIQVMWEIAVRESYNGKKIEESQLKVIKDAIKIRDEFSSYHRNANFDDMNIEDILSLLIFNELGGSLKEKEKFKKFVLAISYIIQITSTVQYNHDKIKTRSITENIYQDFWEAIFNRFSSKNIPTIISFNYDLVIESAMFQTLNVVANNNDQVFDKFCIDYGFDSLKNENFRVENLYKRGSDDYYLVRSIDVKEEHLSSVHKIKIFKLHGSLNFPSDTKSEIISPFKIIDNPLILPPVFNKMQNQRINSVWKNALKALREAKRIIIVGYSLPVTDIYMQYFLKSAVGPNINLDKIIVYNPALSEMHSDYIAIKNRFNTCFAEQLIKNHRVKFVGNNFQHFVNDIRRKDVDLFF